MSRAVLYGMSRAVAAWEMFSLACMYPTSWFLVASLYSLREVLRDGIVVVNQQKRIDASNMTRGHVSVTFAAHEYTGEHTVKVIKLVSALQ
jgi:hypothetical protein